MSLTISIQFKARVRGKKTESPCIFKANKIREDNRLKNGSKSVKKSFIDKVYIDWFYK